MDRGTGTGREGDGQVEELEDGQTDRDRGERVRDRGTRRKSLGQRHRYRDRERGIVTRTRMSRVTGTEGYGQRPAHGQTERDRNKGTGTGTE